MIRRLMTDWKFRMMVLLLAGMLAGLFLLAGLLTWSILWFSNVPAAGWKSLKYMGWSYLLSLPLFLVLILPLLFSYLIARSSTRPQDLSYSETPTVFGSAYDSVTFSSRDGVQLEGWFLPGDPQKPTIIFSHGLFRSRRENLERACQLQQRGYSGLIFDFRNHGSSQHRYCSLGFQERLDVLGAYAFLKKKNCGRRFVLSGISMGAVASIHAAEEMGNDLVALVADSPFLNLRETTESHIRLFLGVPIFPFSDLFIWNLTRMADFEESDLDTSRALRRLDQVPVLLIFSEEDRRIDTQTAQAILKTVPHEKKRMIRFPQTRHGAAYPDNPDQYLQVIESFLNDYVVDETGSAL